MVRAETQRSSDYFGSEPKHSCNASCHVGISWWKTCFNFLFESSEYFGRVAKVGYSLVGMGVTSVHSERPESSSIVFAKPNQLVSPPHDIWKIPGWENIDDFLVPAFRPCPRICVVLSAIALADVGVPVWSATTFICFLVCASFCIVVRKLPPLRLYTQLVLNMIWGMPAWVTACSPANFDFP